MLNCQQKSCWSPPPAAYESPGRSLATCCPPHSPPLTVSPVSTLILWSEPKLSARSGAAGQARLLSASARGNGRRLGCKYGFCRHEGHPPGRHNRGTCLVRFIGECRDVGLLVAPRRDRGRPSSHRGTTVGDARTMTRLRLRITHWIENLSGAEYAILTG